MQLTFFTWILAFLPVLTVLALMLGLRWGGSRAGAVGWFTALIVAAVFFGAGPQLLTYAQVKAVLLSLDVLYIIWTALLLFHTAAEAGALTSIGRALTALTPDRMMQGLLLGWLFASFLQGMGGFGVPVAVAAPLLVSLGFSPIPAVVMALVGHGWAVNFGSLATSFQTLLAVTNLPGELLASDSAILLGISSYFCGAIVAFLADGWKGLLRGLPAVLILGTVMSVSQYLLVTNGIWTLGATGGAMVGLLVGLGLARLPFYRRAAAQCEPTAEMSRENGRSPRSLLLAVSGYLILVVLAFGINLIPPLSRIMSSVQLNLDFPELATRTGWVTAAGPGRPLDIFGHPGAILLYASVLAYLIYKKSGSYTPGAEARIWSKVARGAVNSSLGILAMVGMAVMMTHAGMTNQLAQGLSLAFGPVYPLISPFIGALGAFITGSNNNSNVLFAVLQMNTAQLLGLPVPLILGAQTAGGSLGSIMAPAKVIVGCSTVGLSHEEGRVVGKVIAYGMLPVAVVAVAVLVMAGLGRP
ncbi:MAG: L-lactate permease [Bellilinea sp.]